MMRAFEFSPLVMVALALVLVAALIVAVWAPSLSVALGMLGALSIAAIWIKVAIRTRKWAWWQFGVEALTPSEGFIGASGAVLFASTFVALIAGMRHAA